MLLWQSKVCFINHHLSEKAKQKEYVCVDPGGRIKCPDYIALINGYSGSVLQLTGTADQRPISIGPILKASGDGGASYIFYITSSAVNSSLYLASLKDVATGRKDLVIWTLFSLNGQRQLY